MTVSTTEDALRRELSEVKEQGFTMAAALHTVICESADAESVRTSIAALLGCPLGRAYLDMHPLRY